MTCEKLIVDGKVVGMICGPRPKHRRGERVTEKQKIFLNYMRDKVAPRLREAGAEANDLGLPIMSRELDYYANELVKKIEMQLRALRDDALTA